MNINTLRRPYLLILSFIIAVSLLLGARIAVAGSNPDPIVNYRHILMNNLQNNLRAISDILRGNLDHQDHLKDLTFVMNITAKQIVDAYKIDTRDNPNSKTTKPGIWKKPDKFSAEIQSLIRDTATLNKLAVSNDLQALKAQVGVVGKNCASCHKKFRNKK